MLDCNLFDIQNFDIRKQNAHLLPENWDQLNNLNTSFVLVLLF